MSTARASVRRPRSIHHQAADRPILQNLEHQAGKAVNLGRAHPLLVALARPPVVPALQRARAVLPPADDAPLGVDARLVAAPPSVDDHGQRRRALLLLAAVEPAEDG